MTPRRRRIKLRRWCRRHGKSELGWYFERAYKPFAQGLTEENAILIGIVAEDLSPPRKYSPDDIVKELTK